MIILPIIAVAINIDQTNTEGNCQFLNTKLQNEYDSCFSSFYHSTDNVCPDCGHRLKMHDSFVRKTFFGSFSAEIICRRVRCPHCGKTHRVVPSEIIPRSTVSASSFNQTIQTHRSEKSISSAAAKCMTDPEKILRLKKDLLTEVAS